MTIRKVPSVCSRFVGYVAMLVALSYGLARPVAAAEIWMASVEPAARGAMQTLQARSDYMDLFRPDAPWATAASGLKVFKVSGAFGLHSTDENMQTLINDLKRRHIALAIEFGVLVGGDRCGRTVEGYAAPTAVDTLVKRIKKFGGQIDYIAMDEPVWFGHAAKGAPVKGGSRAGIVGGHFCEDPIADLVDQIAPKIEILRQAFPNIQVGEIDPVSAKWPSEVDDMAQFADLYRKKTGVPLAFVHTDVSWETNWKPLLEGVAEQAHKRGIRLGVICDGDSTARTNEEWVSSALQHCKAIAADPKVKPDDFIVQTWQALPNKMLPETDPGAMTFAVKQAETMLH
jgi:hypothetical protein